MRILLSEGASTSARQAVTALSLAGHEVEICDPDPHCLARFSRLVRRFHRCPGLGTDPEGYLAFVLDEVKTGRIDVLLPIHEQGFLFAKVQDRLAPHAAMALPSFEAYEGVHSKAGFSRILNELGLPQPETRFVSSPEELNATIRFPFYLKTAIGTASRGTWLVRDPDDLAAALSELQVDGGFDQPVLMQERIEGPVEHAQGVFAQGRLVGFHAYAQVARGAGGGDAIKESVGRPVVRAHLETLGERLSWHGALTLDYLVGGDGGPLYIDCNPRLVEPMSASFAGLDLASLLVRVSCGEVPVETRESRAGVRTHLGIQALMGAALRGASRRALLREGWQLLTKRGPYAGSREELTPVALDPLSAVPLALTALLLLARPKGAGSLAKGGWGAHLLNPEAIRRIRALGDAPSVAAAV